mmetsp:Transcript_109414/g.309544  ORF Transcript_109414/g.309544 Transcript_109414/m.309544 type:complete len:296 (+) Transcript_109414:210-1097(+)
MRASPWPSPPATAPKCSAWTRSVVAIPASGRMARSLRTSCSTWSSSCSGAAVISSTTSSGLSVSFTFTRARSRSLEILLPRLPITQATSSFGSTIATARPLPWPLSRGTRSAGSVGPSFMLKCASVSVPKRVMSSMNSWTFATANSTSRSVGPVMRRRFCSARPLTASRTMWRSQFVSPIRPLMRAPFSPMRWEQLTSGIITSTVRWCWSSSSPRAAAAPPGRASSPARSSTSTGSWRPWRRRRRSWRSSSPPPRARRSPPWRRRRRRWRRASRRRARGAGPRGRRGGRSGARRR